MGGFFLIAFDFILSSRVCWFFSVFWPFARLSLFFFFSWGWLFVILALEVVWVVVLCTVSTPSAVCTSYSLIHLVVYTLECVLAQIVINFTKC